MSNNFTNKVGYFDIFANKHGEISILDTKSGDVVSVDEIMAEKMCLAILKVAKEIREDQ